MTKSETRNISSLELAGYDPDIDLKEMFSVLWDRKIAIILITALFSACSLMIAINMSDYYKSEAILKVHDEGGNSGMMSNSAQAVSRLVGINMMSNQNDRALLMLQTVQSRAFLKHLLTFEGVLPSLMAAEGYDKENKTLIYDTNAYDPETKTWVNGDDSSSPGTPPSLAKAYRTYTRGVIDIWHDMASGTRYLHVSVSHVSPIFAKELLELIIHEVNEQQRIRDLKDSSAALEFLENELRNTSLVPLQSSINNLIQNQLEIQMAARIREDYITVAIEPPFVPEEKYWPNKLLAVLLGTFLGGGLSPSEGL